MTIIRAARRRGPLALIGSTTGLLVSALVALCAGFIAASLVALAASSVYDTLPVVYVLFSVGVTGCILLAAYLQRSAAARAIVLCSACGAGVAFALAIGRLRGIA
ncbi:hypothetical protein [Gordonia shandongensis]|uniref:hypothetical protein n=1 Tax=Gordonia shandongensis TaxID=376351 RepID=UPI00040980DE|nr:hypothetical protein [Gordonia shandongensis]